MTFSDVYLYAVKIGCGSSGVSWLRCEDLTVVVFRVVDAFVLAAEVEAPAGFEVAVGDDGAELEDVLGAFQAPSRSLCPFCPVPFSELITVINIGWSPVVSRMRGGLR